MTATRWDHLLLDCNLVTLAGDTGYGVIERGALGWRDGVITFADAMSELPGAPDSLATKVESLHGACVTPGLVDCHTHLVFAGTRADEFQRRLRGPTNKALMIEANITIATIITAVIWPPSITLCPLPEFDLFHEALRSARQFERHGR